ncbi:hypothetical protein O6H91_04G018900 [Diphasiastrum complanatum]|nr:hypothetical protein O6H91_04G018900 [Diphasiastrum complanatum]
MESKTQSSIESLSHLSQCSFSPRMGAAMSEDQFSLRSEDSKVKFMCSYGGRIMPRPHDCQLRYVGGETRILVVNRNISLADLMAKLTRLCGKSVLLKYQLPDEDMDSLVSVLCEEDLENMMEEYDRLESRDASAKLRLFLFPSKTHSAAVEFHEYDSRNAEQRFVDAVNGFARRQQSLSVSQGLPDYLFGLDHVLGKHDRVHCALPKANSQPLPGARCIAEDLLEKDHQPSYLNSPPILKPPVTSQQEAPPQNQQSITLDSLIPLSNKGTISVADNPLQGLEAIEQLSSVIPAAAAADVQAAEKQASFVTALSCSNAETTWPRKPELESAQDLNLDLLSPSDAPHKLAKGSLSLHIEEKQLKNSSPTHVTANLYKSVEFAVEDDFVDGSHSKALKQLLPPILDAMSLQSDEHYHFPTDLYSSVQENNKSVSGEVNRDASNLPGQKQDPSMEFARKQHQSSNKQVENSDQTNQKKGGKLSEDRTESPCFLEKAKQGPYLKAEGQQEIIDQYLQEGYKFEDNDIPVKPTVAYSKLQQNLQSHDVPTCNTHSMQWAQGEDQIRQHIDRGAVELPRTSAFLLQQTVPSQTTAPSPRVATAPISLKAYDLPRSAPRQCIVAPQPANLHRQLPAVMPYSELQQQPLPLPRIIAGQSTAREQIAPRAPRVQSPSRFRDSSPSKPFQGCWNNTDERLLRPAQQYSSRGIMLQPIQHDHYVDPSGHMLYEPSISHLHYADHMINSSELTQFSPFQDGVGHSTDQPQDSHSYQSASLHHAKDQPQAGSAEAHRHAIHQVMRT